MAEGAIAGAPLSVARFRHPRLERWIDQVLRDVRPEVVFVYSSALAQYVLGGLPPETKLIVRFRRLPMPRSGAPMRASAPAPLRWVYGAEFHRLARFDARRGWPRRARLLSCPRPNAYCSNGSSRHKLPSCA